MMMRVASVAGTLGRELEAEVDDRVAAAADVDHAEQEMRGVRQAGDRPHVQYLAHVANPDPEGLARETERQILRRFGHLYPQSLSFLETARPLRPRRSIIC